MRTINIRYLETLDKIIIEHYNGDKMTYPLELNKNDIDINQATIMLHKLFQEDIKRITDEYNAALDSLKELEDHQLKTKKTVWIFRKDLYLKALNHLFDKMFYDDAYWAVVVDGKYARFDKDDDQVGVVSDGRKDFLVMKSWCEKKEV